MKEHSCQSKALSEVCVRAKISPWKIVRSIAQGEPTVTGITLDKGTEDR